MPSMIRSGPQRSRTMATTKTPPLQILLIEDDAGVAQIVCGALDSIGGAVTRAATLAEGRRLVESAAFEIIILDLTLPDGNGLDLAKAIRQSGRDVPIVMLTARDSVGERIDGFRHGADDYLCKPFDINELIARLSAVVRRSRAQSRYVLCYADVELDLITRAVRRGETRAALSDREAELLAYFLRHPEQVLPRERILEQVWGDEAEDDSNVLNVYVNYLRNKLEAARYPRLIHTVRGAGYVLSEKDPDELSG